MSWEPCADFQMNSVRYINKTKSPQKSGKQFASKRKSSLNLGKVVVLVIHLYLYMYCLNNYFLTIKIKKKNKIFIAFICGESMVY